MKATVSICIPTYNQADYLEQAILSASNQTIKPLEIIVSDDGSSDATAQILARLKKQVNNLFVHAQKTNLGIAKNVDQCLRMAKGDFIIRLDSDDFLEKDYIERLVLLLKKYPKAGYAHAAVNEVDRNNAIMRRRKLFRFNTYQPPNRALKTSISGYKVAANILMFRRRALEEVGFIRSSIDFAEDYRLSVELAVHGYGNVYCNEILANYRAWEDDDKKRPKRKLEEIKGLTLLFNDVLKPAFIKRKWSLGQIVCAQQRFALRHAESLTEDYFNQKEREEIKSALLELSGTSKTSSIVNRYMNASKSVHTLPIIALTRRFKEFVKRIT